MFFLLACWLTCSSETALDEIYFRSFHGVAGKGDRVFICVSAMKPQVFAYRFSDGEITPMDNRVSLFAVSTILEIDDQIVLIDGLTENMVRFDRDLAYQSKASIKELDLKRESGLWAGTWVPLGEGRVMVTLRGRPDVHRLELVTVDFAAMTVEVMTKKLLDKDLTGYWMPWNEHILFIHASTGRIDLLDATTYKMLETIRPGKEVVDKSHSKFWKPGRPINRWYYQAPYILGDSVYWTLSRFRDADGRPLEKHLFNDSVLKLSPDSGFTTSGKHVFPLAVHRDEALVIDWDGPELKIVPASEVP